MSAPSQDEVTALENGGDFVGQGGDAGQDGNAGQGGDAGQG